MKNFSRNCLLPAACAALLGVASCAGYDPYERDAIGVLSSPDYYSRVVTITPQTKSVIVSQRDVVKFVNAANGRSFVWSFDTRGWGNFDLSAVAPPGVLGDQHVIAYIYEIPQAGTPF